MNDDEAARSKTGHYIQYARLKKRLAVSPQVLGNNRCQTLGKFSTNLSPRVFEVLLPHLRRQSCGSSSLSCCRNKSTCMWLFSQFFLLPDRVSYSNVPGKPHVVMYRLCLPFSFPTPNEYPNLNLAIRSESRPLWAFVARGAQRENEGDSGRAG